MNLMTTDLVNRIVPQSQDGCLRLQIQKAKGRNYLTEDYEDLDDLEGFTLIPPFEIRSRKKEED